MVHLNNHCKTYKLKTWQIPPELLHKYNRAGGRGGDLQAAGAAGTANNQGGGNFLNGGTNASSGGAAGSTGTSNGSAGAALSGNTGKIN